jgi:predicted DNA-binding protein (MmcQ/YjbR family)
MTLEEYDEFCASLPHSTHVIQWGGASVWKVGGKVFAIAGWGGSRLLAVTFKCSPASFDILKEQPGLRPAPYMASRLVVDSAQREEDDERRDAQGLSPPKPYARGFDALKEATG